MYDRILCADSRSFGRRLRAGIRTVAVGMLAFVAATTAKEACAGRVLSSLPHTETFDTNAYANDIVWVTQGGTHTWVANGGWKGGAAKFTPPNAEGYTGLGQFLLSGLATKPAQLNVRFLVYYGATWAKYANTAQTKFIIMNRDGNSGRPMVINRDWQDTGGRWETMGACDGTVCQYQGGGFWPDGTDRLRIGDRALGWRSHEWISVEFEANTTTGMIRLYIDTVDQSLSGLYIERPMSDTGPGGVWSYIDIIGGYMNGGTAQQDPENYFMIDELKIDSGRIGPPPGFTSSVRPNAPNTLRVQ